MPDYQALARCLHDGFGRFLKRVDFENPFHLRQQPVQEPEVTARDPDNGCDGLLVQWVLGKMHALEVSSVGPTIGGFLRRPEAETRGRIRIRE